MYDHNGHTKNIIGFLFRIKFKNRLYPITFI